jgi:hypothetical protein
MDRIINNTQLVAAEERRGEERGTLPCRTTKGREEVCTAAARRGMKTRAAAAVLRITILHGERRSETRSDSGGRGPILASNWPPLSLTSKNQKQRNAPRTPPRPREKATREGERDEGR